MKQNCNDTIERVEYSKISEEKFARKYEKKNKPVIITNYLDSLGDSGKNKWTWSVSFASFTIDKLIFLSWFLNLLIPHAYNG